MGNASTMANSSEWSKSQMSRKSRMAAGGVGLLSLSATREDEGSKRRCREKPPKKRVVGGGGSSKKRKNQKVLGQFMAEKGAKSPKCENLKIMSRGFSLNC